MPADLHDQLRRFTTSVLEAKCWSSTSGPYPSANSPTHQHHNRQSAASSRSGYNDALRAVPTCHSSALGSSIHATLVLLGRAKGHLPDMTLIFPPRTEPRIGL